MLYVHGASLRKLSVCLWCSLTRLPASRYGGLAAFAEATAPEETAAPCEVKSPGALTDRLINCRWGCGYGCDGSSKSAPTAARTSSPSLKIRPDFGVFLVADSVHLFQIISASKRSRGNNSSSHNWPNARNHFQFLFRRGVDVDPAQLDFFFCMRPFNLDWTYSGGRRAQWRWRCGNPGERIRRRQRPGSGVLFGYENTKRRWLLSM